MRIICARELLVLLYIRLTLKNLIGREHLNQFTIACEPAADIAFIMSSSKSAWVLSPLECFLRNKMAERFASVSEDELCEKCIIKQLLNSVFAWYHELQKPKNK